MPSTSVNRHQETDKNAAGLHPELNKCSYANGIIQVRLEHGLTFEDNEANAPDTITTTVA